MITPRHFDDQQLAERYLVDQLSPQEQAELEEYYSDHPQVLRDLQAVAGIKIGLASLRASGELQQLTARRRTRWPLLLAVAASLLLAGGGYWWRAQLQAPPLHAATTLALLDPAGTPLPLGATYDVQRTRSDVDVIIDKPATAGVVLLRLLDELDPPPAKYRLELHTLMEDEARRVLAAVGGLMVDEVGSLNVYVDPSRLELGSYELQLFEDGAAVQRSVLSNFLLDVVADDAPAQAPEVRR